jgi:hypothetical protein
MKFNFNKTAHKGILVTIEKKAVTGVATPS